MCEHVNVDLWQLSRAPFACLSQTLLELAARSHWPGLLQSLLPALNLSRLAGSGALSAGHCTTPLQLSLLVRVNGLYLCALHLLSFDGGI